MKKVLVTGANGFLGCNLTRELYRQGYEVRVMVRPQAELKGLADIPCELYYGHVDVKQHVYEAMAGCEMVVHAAAITDQWDIAFEEYESINFTATRFMTEAALHYGVERFIFVSTANTMAPGSKEQPGTELNGFTLFSADSGYITTKYLAQQFVLEQVELKNLPAVIVNPTFMIGPYDIKPSSGKLLLYGVGKKLLFYPPGGKNFVYIGDVCTGIVNAIDNGKPGECYLLANQNLSYKQFFRMVNPNAILVQIPNFILKLAGVLGSLKQRLFRRAGKLNNTTAYLLCLDNYYSGKKSERELALSYTPVELAVEEALDWFKENNYI